MRFDSGEITFFTKSNSAQNGLMPVGSYTPIMTTCYSDLTVGVSRFNQAKQNDAIIAMLLRIPRTHVLNSGDVATLAPYAYDAGDAIYQVYQVQYTEDDNGLPVTDVSLERYRGLDAGEIIAAQNGARGSL